MAGKIKLLLDENLPLSLIKLFEAKGFQVEHVKLSSLRGKSDKEIALYAKKEESILFTKDIEFSSLVIYPKNFHYGLVVLRLPYFFTTQQITNALEDFINSVNVQELIGKRVILELGKYRIREM